MESKRDFLVEIGLEDSIVFENPDYELMIEHLMEKDGMSYEEAMEFIDYNTVRACPYMGDKAPIILEKFNQI